MSIKAGCRAQGGSSGWRKDLFFKQYLRRVTGYFKHIVWRSCFFFRLMLLALCDPSPYLGGMPQSVFLLLLWISGFKNEMHFRRFLFSIYKTYHISPDKYRVFDKCPWMIPMPFSCNNCNKRFPLTSVLLSLNKNKCHRLKGKRHTVLIKNLITSPCLLK